jgi:protein PhnA
LTGFSKCLKCSSVNIYFDGSLWNCPDCFHEWAAATGESVPEAPADSGVVRDVNGNELRDGDSVTIVKDLKVKGSSTALKAGTKVRNIRINIDGPDGHDISCKIDGFGSMNLKSSVVKKA